MNKAGKTKIILSSILTLVILISSIYIFMPENVKLDIGKTNSKFYVWENEDWILSATEYVNLFDGTTKMRAKSRELATTTLDDITTITRTSIWKDNITTIDTYTFDSTVTDVRLFPVTHEVEVINAIGKIVHFEYRDILYTGETRIATSPEEFGHKMKIEWQEGAYYSKLFQQKTASDKLIVRYRPTSDYEVYSVRIFDPPTTSFCYQEFANVATACGGLSTGTYTQDGTWDAGATYIKTIDGDWDTYGATDYTSPPSTSNSYMNYTKPEGAYQATSLWEIKVSNTGRINVTIPESCWNYDSDTLLLRLYSDYPNPINSTDAQCYNGTWNKLAGGTTIPMYEEAMWWSIDTPPTTQTSTIKTDTASNLCYDDIVANSNELGGWCNVTSSGGDDVTYNWIWYKDDVFFSGYEVGASTITYSNISTPNYEIENPEYAYDGNSATYAGYTGIGVSGGRIYYNISKPFKSPDISEFSFNLDLENTGTSPGASFFAFYCVDEVGGISNTGISPTSAGTSPGTRYNQTITITNTDCLSLYDDTVEIYVNFGAAPNVGTKIYEINNISVDIGTSHTEGVDVNLYNVPIADISTGDEWTFSCRGNDGTTNSEWLNSTTVPIHDVDFLIDGVDVRTLSNPITKELGSVILNASIDAYDRNISSLSTSNGNYFSCNNNTDKLYGYESSYIFNWTVGSDGTPTYDSAYTTITGKVGTSVIDYYYNISDGYHYLLYSDVNNISIHDETGGFVSTYATPFTSLKSMTGDGTNLYFTSANETIIVTDIIAGSESLLSDTYGYCYEVGYDYTTDTLWCSDFTDGTLTHWTTAGVRIAFESATVTKITPLSVCGDLGYLYAGSLSWYDISDNYVCIDDSNTAFGTNYSCDVTSTQFDAEVSQFHTRTTSDSESTLQLNYTGAENKTFKIQGHENDDFNSLTLNVSGAGDSVKVYVGTTLSNTLGLMSDTSTYNQTKFNDTSITKNANITTNATIGQVGLFRMPKTATITSANMTITGIESTTYPVDPWMEIGLLDGVKEWNYTGTFNSNNRDGNWSDAITTYLAVCTADSDGFCYVPLYGYSEEKGALQASLISIAYTYTMSPITISSTAVQAALTAGSGYTNVTIKVENGETGNVTISGIDYNYLGGISSGDTIRAHSADNFCNISNVLKYSYSGYDYDLPPNINNINWYPNDKNAKNVTPFGQTLVYPMINVTTTNYGDNLDFSIKMYGSADCVDLYVDTDNSKVGATLMVNDTYITLASNQPEDSNVPIWLWADLTCSYNDWRVWIPSFDLKAEATI